MMSIEAATLVWDAKNAADLIVSFTAELNLDDYLANPMVRAAVEREFEIIGEALNRLRALDPITAAEIPEVQRAVGMRNVLIHGYANIDHGRIWKTVQDDLAPLLVTLNKLLSQAPDLAP